MLYFPSCFWFGQSRLSLWWDPFLIKGTYHFSLFGLDSRARLPNSPTVSLTSTRTYHTLIYFIKLRLSFPPPTRNQKREGPNIPPPLSSVSARQAGRWSGQVPSSSTPRHCQRKNEGPKEKRTHHPLLPSFPPTPLNCLLIHTNTKTLISNALRPRPECSLCINNYNHMVVPYSFRFLPSLDNSNRFDTPYKLPPPLTPGFNTVARI